MSWEHDCRRTEYLRELNICVRRFENRDVFECLDWVLHEIGGHLTKPAAGSTVGGIRGTCRLPVTTPGVTAPPRPPVTTPRRYRSAPPESGGELLTHETGTPRLRRGGVARSRRGGAEHLPPPGQPISLNPSPESRIPNP